MAEGTIKRLTGARMAGITALLCLLSGCLKEPPSPGLRAERIVILIESAPRELDPRYASDASSTKVSRLLHCALFHVETDDLRPVAEAAIGLEPACPEGPGECRHWIVELRRDIYWSDGVRVTPADVVFTYRSLIGAKRPSPYRGELQRRIEKVWEADGRVHFQLTAPYASFPVDLAIGLVPEHVLSSDGGLDGGFGEEMVGCGPFRLHSRYRNQKVVLERNEFYWGEVKPRYVEVRTVPDEATRVLAMMGGSGDIVVNALSPPVVRTLEERGDVEVLHRRAACTTYLTYNLLDQRLADLRVRKAIALGIDRETLVREQFRHMAVVADTIIPPLHWAYSGLVEQHTYNPAQARALLDEAGFSVDKETGYRFALTLKVTTDFFRKNIGSLIAYRLGEIGIKVELLPLELSTFLADVRKGNFELYILQLPQIIDPDILRWLLYSQAAPVLTPQPDKSAFGAADRRYYPPGYQGVSGPFSAQCRKRWLPLVEEQALAARKREAAGAPLAIGNGNRSFYTNPELDCLLDLGNLTMVEAQRAPYYERAQQIIARDLPILPLWHEDNVAVVRHGVTGYRLLPLNRYGPVTGVHRAGGAR
jgi:peptide/nickel transport system substrate-binding protein